MEEKKFDRNLAERLRGGVIMDVTSPEQARIAEAAGAVAVMALERVPADIRAAGGVSRMSDPKVIKAIQNAVSIPVMAKCRIGHFVEAQILQALGIDYIDESEVLSPADDVYHVDKRQFPASITKIMTLILIFDALEEEKNDTIAANKNEYDKLLGEPHETAEGLVTFHLLKDKLYLELPTALLGRHMLLGSTVSGISDNTNAIVGSKPHDPLPFVFSVSGKKLCMEIPDESYVVR